MLAPEAGHAPRVEPRALPDGSLGRQPARQSLLIGALFGGLFVWWGLGVGGFIPALFAVPLLASIGLRGRMLMPRAYLLWLAFLAWVSLSAIGIHDFERWVSFAWRGSLYVTAGLLFIYVFNGSRSKLTTRTMVLILAAFWVQTVLGGFAGMVLPSLSFPTPMEMILPSNLLSNQFVHDLVHATTAATHAFSGTGIHRPKVPFIYSNQWGSTFALTLPFAIASLPMLRRGIWRTGMLALLVVSIVPLVVSFDRGSWLSVAVSMGYATFRLAARGSRRAFRTALAMVVGTILAGVVLLATPLGDLVVLRLNSGYGDSTRAILYESSVRAVLQSPILGYGTPVSVSLVNPSTGVAPSAGTHGQFWTVLVSQGIPGIVFFGGWFVMALFKSGRRISPRGRGDPDTRFWAHVCIAAGLVQMAYYELLPWGLPIMMIAAALAWREARVEGPLGPPGWRVPQRTVIRRASIL